MTQAILLGAGRSSRMDTERGDGPKWMLQIRGLSLAQHLVNVLHQCDVTEIVLARGLLGGSVQTPSVIYRDVLDSKNMLQTLYAVRDVVHDDVLILYCDLLIEPRLLAALLRVSAEAAVVIDSNWQELFRLRADDPISIAESCTIEGGLIKQIGQPLLAGDVPEAQYIGMMRFSKRIFAELMRLYEQLSSQYSGRPWRNAKAFETAFMTDFLQECVDRKIDLTAVVVPGGWLEFDTPRDLAVAREILLGPLPQVFGFEHLWTDSSVVSSGGVAVRETGSAKDVLLVGTGEPGEWRIPKGMLEPGEGRPAAARREVHEETGIRVEIQNYIGAEEWTYEFGGRRWREKCYFYSMVSQHAGPPRPDTENAVAAWLPADVAITGMKYAQERRILLSALGKQPDA